MPKRTNHFQRLITYITEQVSPFGATVTESAELLESGVARPVKREIDILVELKGGLTELSVAIECRDRGRRDHIEWIDALVGKYANLPVDQVIAISSSSFTDAAREKAALNNIRTMSLSEAVGADWPDQFARLAMLIIEQTYSIDSVRLEVDPVIDGDIPAESIVVLRIKGEGKRGRAGGRTTLGEIISLMKNSGENRMPDPILGSSSIRT